MKFSRGKVLSTGLVILAALAAATPQTQGSSCTPPPSGIVGWWKGDGNTVDSVGENNGVAANSTYTNGVVGLAFSFDPENYSYGTYTGIQVADKPAYALTNSLTIEGWIQPRGDGYVIFFRGDHRPGLDPYILSMQANNTLLFNICDADGNTANVGTTVNYFAWTHVAATLDGSSGTLSIYTNGVLAVQTNTTIRPFGSLLADQSPGIGIGNVNDGGNNFPFTGDIDEISLYSRALTGNEIQSIYNAGSAGKCSTPSPPIITSFNPAAGSPGAMVTITGANFNATAASNIVYFGAVQATVSSASANSLTVTIPPGATYAPITVTVNGLTADASVPFLPTFAGNGAAIDSSTFAAGFNLPTANGPGRVVMADLDGDGRPDLVVNDGSAGVFSIYQNIGTNGVLNAGTFAAPITFSVASNSGPVGLVAADLNGDGKLDLVLSDRNNNQIAVFQNVSSGGMLTTNSFAAPVYFAVGADPRTVAVSDLDGDGLPDILCVNNGSGTVSILRNTGATGSITTNSFAARMDLPMAGYGEGLAVGDLDGDGKPDIAVTDSTGFVSVFRNKCTPGNISPNTFDARLDLAAQNGTIGVAIGDLDGDGKAELISTAYLPQTMSVYRNLSSPGTLTINSFAAPVDYALAGRGHNIALSDINGDGKLDIAVVTELNSALSLFQNIGSGGFISTSLAARVDFAAGWNAWGVAVGDLDGDGRPDAVFANSYDNTITVYHNQAPFGTPPPPPPPSCTPAPSGLVGWWKGEGNADDSAGTNNGSLSGSGATYAAGEVGQGFRFDGISGYVQIPDADALKPANVTVEAWVWLDPNVNSNAPATEQIIFKRNSWTFLFEGYSLAKTSIDNGDGTYTSRFQFVVTRNGNQVVINSSTVVQRGVWYHVAATYDGNQSTLFVNGVAEASAVAGFALDYGTRPVFIGTTGEPAPYTSMFGGIIDEPSIYNRALATNEIQAIYNAGSAGKCSTPTAPFITAQPTNQNVAVGSTVSFTVAVQGASPLNYQWSFNTTNLVGATNVSLVLTNVQLNQAGNYAVLVTNIYGAAASSNAVLSVFVPAVPPTILSQTPSEVVLLGSSANFSVTASGTDPLSYFWKRDGSIIPGATNFSYTLNNAQLSDSGSKFTCLVTNAYGSAASTNATLKVIDTVANDLCSGAILITNAGYTNAQSTLKASAFGDPVPDCVDGFGHGVWYQFTAPVSGLLIVDTFGSDFDTGLALYTGSCDALTEVACNDDTGGVTSQVTLPTTAGMTYFILAGGYSSDAGNLVLHLNHLTPPAFTVQPANQSVVVSSNASFSATLTGALPMSFQWYFNSTPLVDDGRIGGSATANLSISNITTADAGSYTLAVTNFLGSTSSTAAVLTVLVPPAITTQPIGRSVPPGLPTTFNVVASGNPTPGYYQWQLNGTNIPGATSASYTVAAVGTNDLGFYHVVASNLVGVAVSTDAQLTFGPVAAWGLNSSGECLPPPGLSNVIAVAGGWGASFAVRTDGTIATWGTGSAANIPANATNVVAVSAFAPQGPFSGNYALRADGTVVSWGGFSAPVLSNIVSVASGPYFGYAVRAEGTLTNWKMNSGNLIPTFPSGLNQVTAVACGFGSAVALRNDGTIAVAAGSGIVTNVPAGLSNVVAVAAGFSYAMVLKNDGTVVAWGSGTGTNLPSRMTNIVAISAGNYSGENFGLAVRADGSVITWGDNLDGDANPPAALTNLFSIAGAAAAFHGLALVNDGSPVILHPPVGLTAYTGRDVTLQASAAGAQPLNYQWLLNGTNVPGATNATLIIPNIQFANAGSYQLFVSNSINTAISLPAPVKVVVNNMLIFLSQTSVSSSNVYQGGKVTFYGGTVLGSGPLGYQWLFSPTNKNYTVVPGATNDTLVLDPALAWQSGNYYLAVSNGFLNQPYMLTSAPVNVKVLFARAWGFQAVSNPPVNVTNAIAVATGGYQDYYGDYFALGADGKLTSWANYTPIYGETNVSALSNSFVTAIAAGTQHSLALKSDGTVYAWGYGGYGQTNPPAGLNSVVAIACGGYHDLALKSDGTVVGWGDTLQAPVYGQATNNPDATNVVAIAAGNLHSLALRADGSVVAWGYNFDGSTTIPFAATNVIAIAAGSGFSAALRANGTVVRWGTGLANYPVPANLSNVVAISGSGTHCTALRNDGMVVSWGYEYTGNASNNVPPDLANVAAISSGGDHDFGLLGTRGPIFTVQPWSRTLIASSSVVPVTTITLAGKCVGVQPMSYQWRLNGTNYPGATNDTLTVRYDVPSFKLPPGGVYQLVASNAYGVTVSKPAKVTWTYSLGYALNASSQNWTTTGNAPWFGETNITHDGVSAAQSGGIGPLQETILQTTFGTNWSGHYTFWWKVSSELDFDFLEFRINGAVQTNISGEVNWTQVSIPVASGTNVLMWRYSKDATFDAGLDAGFVDQFAFVADGPTITLQPVSQTVNMGTNVTFQIAATGQLRGFLLYQWRQNGTPLAALGPVLNLNNVGRAQNGTYVVTVTDAISGNSTVSSNAVLKVLVPQLLGSPVLLPDGTFQLKSTDADGGLLAPSDLANFDAQASTNLVNWVTLTNALSLTNGMLQLQDSGRSNNTVRYYRLIEH